MAAAVRDDEQCGRAPDARSVPGASTSRSAARRRRGVRPPHYRVQKLLNSVADRTRNPRFWYRRVPWALPSATVSTPVIFVSGPPGSGKTTVATRLAADLVMPLVARDEIKEILLDALGSGDVAWSQLLGGASYEVLYHALESQLRAKRSVIVESNFVAARCASRLQALRDTYGFEPVEVHCTASAGTIIERYTARAPFRHAGHHDAARIDDVAAALADQRYAPLNLGGALILVDTTNFATVDLDAVVADARELTERR